MQGSRKCDNAWMQRKPCVRAGHRIRGARGVAEFTRSQQMVEAEVEGRESRALGHARKHALETVKRELVVAQV